MHLFVAPVVSVVSVVSLANMRHVVAPACMSCVNTDKSQQTLTGLKQACMLFVYQYYYTTASSSKLSSAPQELVVKEPLIAKHMVLSSRHAKQPTYSCFAGKHEMAMLTVAPPISALCATTDLAGRCCANTPVF